MNLQDELYKLEEDHALERIARTEVRLHPIGPDGTVLGAIEEHEIVGFVGSSIAGLPRLVLEEVGAQRALTENQIRLVGAGVVIATRVIAAWAESRQPTGPYRPYPGE